MEENRKTMEVLFYCMESSSCGQNQTKIVILGSFHFRGAFEGWDGGEDIWARSTVIALRSLGYSFLYSWNLERTVHIYKTFPNLVVAIFDENGEVTGCFKDPTCLMSESNLHGIPAWKIFAFHWWTYSSHPLGPQWTLSPELYLRAGNDHTYLGYSIEPSCALRPFIPHSKRKAQVYVMGKNGGYFAPEERAWEPEELALAATTAQVQFVAGLRDDAALPAPLDNMGHLSQREFYEALAQSVALVGMGSPGTSPTPYDSLCLGIPFVNPIIEWDLKNPDDRTKWSTQHQRLQYFDPPYVYNVYKGDRMGFVDAIQRAIDNPIDSYVVDEMRISAIEQRLGRILTTDWRAEAQIIIDQRRASGQGEVFLI
ncbi:hypothetical protein C8R43DRAFT_1186860 [Mycena crocata]|nr:hypothetical protein C8R43DRAFT_1186860 [Mycena crocata]